MKDEFHAQVNSLAQTRDRLVKLRTALLNKVHAHFRAQGRESRREAYDHPGNLRAVLREQWPASVRLELEVIAAQDPEPHQKHREAGEGDLRTRQAAQRARLPDKQQGHWGIFGDRAALDHR
jgi:hypothetical protein